MNKIHHVKFLEFTEELMKIEIDDLKFEIPISEISQKLQKANKIERVSFVISPSGYGISWPLIDEDISIEKILKSGKYGSLIE